MSFFIQENDLIIQEADIKHQTPSKAVWRMVIQTADDVNRNGRKYPRYVLENAIKECDSMIKGRSFYGEMDHPLITADQSFNEQRQTTVLLRDVSHIIRDYDWDGNMLVGEFETLSTDLGMKALALIRDKTQFGTSMRGLAELDKHRDHNEVKDPLTIIAYDLVSRPSHSKAVIDERVVNFESINMLRESHNGKMICTPDGRCFLADYFDRLVEQKTIKFFTNWV